MREHVSGGLKLPKLERPPRGYLVVVDDDPDLRDLIRMQLTKIGYEVATAADGPTALALISRRTPDAVVLDVSMPGMSGVEICRQLRCMDNSTLPIVMLTARNHIQTETDARMAGADAYLAKPFTIRVLAACVEDLLMS